jgi:hypothetical protein
LQARGGRFARLLAFGHEAIGSDVV